MLSPIALAESRDALKRIQHIKIQGAKTRAIINWIEHGDKGSKYFFWMLRNKEARDKIGTLREEDNLITEPVDFKSLCSILLQTIYIRRTKVRHGKWKKKN